MLFHLQVNKRITNILCILSRIISNMLKGINQLSIIKMIVIFALLCVEV